MTDGRRVGWGRWVGVAALVIAAAIFSFLNAGERVTLSLGFTVLYRISLVALVFGSFLVGMVTMFLFGLRYDRRVRQVLRDQYYKPPSPDFYTTPAPPPPPPPSEPPI